MDTAAHGRLFLLLGCFAAFAGGSCKDPPGDGFLLIQVMTPDLTGTPLANIGAVEVQSPRVDVVHRSDCSNPSTEKVLTVSSTPTTIILNAGKPNIPALVGGQVAVPPGCVLQIRVITDSMQVTLGGTPGATKVPSGPQTGIKIIPIDESKPFTVVKDKTTLVRVNYDPNESLVINKGQGIIEKPVLRGTQVDPELAIGVVLDEVVLTFDKGTSQADIQNLVTSAGDTIIAQYPHEFVTVKLPNTGVLRDRINFYTGKSHVKIALPNTLLALQGPNAFPVGTPNDPLYVDKPQAGFNSGNFDAVHALDAWRITTGDTSVVAGLVDNGFDVMHQDLAPNIWINENEIPATFKMNWKVHHFPYGITWDDLNDQVNNAGLCPIGNHPPNGQCDPLDLVDGKGTKGYGWQDDSDDDPNGGNSFKDDVFGWDFVGKDNLPEPTMADPKSWHGTATAGLMAGVGHNMQAGTGSRGTCGSCS